jgi:hypothetical protein
MKGVWDSLRSLSMPGPDRGAIQLWSLGSPRSSHNLLVYSAKDGNCE